jgi:putative spermidine/putrescine transport system permease protein
MLRLTRGARAALGAIVAVVLIFMYTPLMLVIVNSFNEARISSWPIKEFSFRWWGAAFRNDALWQAVGNSVIVGLGAMIIALLLGTLAAFALQRFDFFGKQTVNLLIVLPIALPGVVTGVAFSNTYNNVLEPAGIQLGYFGMIVAHATFCIVMVFNNVFARLRRMSPSMQEASMDLGASLWQTFRLVTFPQFRTAFVAGALLAFALSFDELVVTIFTAPAGVDTLPLWIFNQMARPNEATQVNVIATVLILLSFIPVYVSQRLSRAEEDER